MVAYAVRFADVRLPDVAAVGGKGANLGELTRAGQRVPAGFVVTTAAFVAAMATVDPDGGDRARIARLDPRDIDLVARWTADLRDRVAQVALPDAVSGAVLDGYRELDGPVAIRSSATGEDSAEASFAGLQDTYLWVLGEQHVLASLRRCWASLYNAESVTYRLRRRRSEEQMAVVVQRMVDPRSAGVMFTRSPLTGDRSVVAIEAVWGLGSALVGGGVTPDRFVVNKVTGEVVQRVVSSKARRHRLDPAGSGVLDDEVPADLRAACCLTDGDVAALVAIAKRVEEHYGAAQDIEWAITPDGDVFVLQSRPETVWAQRDAVPVAPSHARAFDHVLDLLGGLDRTGGRKRGD
jgi:pyruvate,water dikinase